MRLSPEEKDLLQVEVAEALGQVRSPEMRALYAELLEAVEAGDVPDALIEPLTSLLAVGLESGRIRRLHTAYGEMTASRMYGRTPQGQAVRASTEAVNEALKALEGHVLQEVTVSPHGPGSYSVSLGTDQGKVLLRLDRQGARIQSVDVGG
jgi:hypothetical protein